MVIITDANGNIQSPTIPENVYQGSNLANEIVFLAPLAQSNVATISFKLPNGQTIEEQTMTPYTSVPSEYNLSGWKYDLNDVITQYYGQVSFQIFVYGASPSIYTINEEPAVTDSFSYSADFVSKGTNFSSISADGSNLVYGSTTVYNKTTGWVDVRYQQIKFTNAIASTQLADWLGDNATEESSSIVSSVAGTFPVLRGVPRLPHSNPSQSSWQQIIQWVADVNGKIANGNIESIALLPYDAGYIYSLGASVFDESTKSIYTSLVTDNVGNSLSDTDYWGETHLYSQAEIQSLINTSIAGKQDVIDNSHKLSADLVDDTGTTNKFVTASDITTWNAKQDALTLTQLDAVNSGIDSAKVGQIATNTNDISAINGKIPAQASAENQLADKDFVNSSIATNTANFIGTFEKVELLQNVGYLVIYSVLKEESVIAKGSVVNGTTYNHDTTLNSDLNITADSTLAFGSVIKSGSVIEIGSIINHEEYEIQTTTSADITVETITNNDYANVINQVIDFIDLAHMNAYDKDLLTNYDYAWIPNGAKYDLYRFDIVTQTWESRATNINKTDVQLITAYNRYTYNGSTEEWTWNYTVNTSGFTAAQWAAINSGATATQISKIGTAVLTTTAQDLSGAVNELDSDLSGKENTSNKVTSLSNLSTDDQYPSAKCVYDALITKANKSTSADYTLSSANWVSNEYTLSVTGKTANNNAIVYPSNTGTNQQVLDNVNAIAAANIYKIVDNGTTLTLVCENTPSTNLLITVEIYE